MKNKVFVRCPNWLGDIIMSIPAINAICSIFEDSQVWLYVRKEYAGILNRIKGVSVISFQKKNVLYEVIESLPKIKEKHFSVSVTLPNSWSSALIPFLAGIKKRYGYAIRGRSIFFTHPIEIIREVLNLHQVYYYLGIVNGIKRGNYNDVPSLEVNEDEIKEIKKKFKLYGNNFCGFVPGAAYGEAKCWFKDRYVALGEKLAKKGFHILLFGSKDDMVRCNEIEKGIGKNVINLAGKTAIDDLPVFMKICKFVISNDSGPMHVSAAVNTPVIGIFGSTNPKTTYPFGYKDFVIHKELECSYCLDRNCKLKINKMRCMELITVEEVLKKLETHGLI